MNDKIKELFEAVREVCPETKEFTMGCKFRYCNQEMTYLGDNKDCIDRINAIAGGKVSELSRDEIFTWEDEKGNELYEPIADVEIIGHPIRLEHLLRTVAESGKYLMIDQRGDVRQWGDELSICTIDLTKSIENQEEATLIQLANIIL
jgi:hypothetical protein